MMAMTMINARPETLEGGTMGAVGLTVAIPCYIFYKYILGRVDRTIVQMEERSLHIVDVVSNIKDSPA